MSDSTTPPEDPPILPPGEILNDPAIHATTIADLVERDPLDLSDEDIHKIIHALRAQRRNFAALEVEKSRGNVSPRARKLPGAPRERVPVPFSLDDLDIQVEGLAERGAKS